MSLPMSIKSGALSPHPSALDAACRRCSAWPVASVCSACRMLLHAEANPFAPKPTHFPAKAKRIIYLVMNGGMSHVDTFDPKPMLSKYNGQPMPGGPPKTERSTGNLFASPFASASVDKAALKCRRSFRASAA